MQESRHESVLDGPAWASVLLTLIILAAVLLTPLFSSAQSTGGEAAENLAQAVAPRESELAQSGADARGSGLSPRFSAAALHALSILRGMRTHVAYSLNNSQRLPKFWLAGDREFAANAVDLATAAASTETEQAVLHELQQHNAALQHWIDDLLVAQREMRLAEYYMSPDGLQQDSQYQALLASEESLRSALGSSRAPVQQELPEANGRAADSANAH
jgi:hypothetical protein